MCSVKLARLRAKHVNYNAERLRPLCIRVSHELPVSPLTPHRKKVAHTVKGIISVNGSSSNRSTKSVASRTKKSNRRAKGKMLNDKEADDE